MYKQFTFAAVLALASQVSAVKIAATQEIDLTAEAITLEPITVEVAPVEEQAVTVEVPQATATVIQSVTDSLPSFMTEKSVKIEELASNPSWVTDRANGFMSLPRIQ